jgi:hypothetical protein
MDEKLFRSIVKVFGEKLCELHVGFSAMFNLCVRRGVFDPLLFQEEAAEIEKDPTLMKLREFLSRLDTPIQDEEIETFLREYKGLIH